MQRWHFGQESIIVNKSPYLTFRDYKRAALVGETAKIPINLMTKPIGDLRHNFGITYSSLDNFITSCKLNDLLLHRNIIILLDEFDSVVFEFSEEYVSTTNIIKKIPELIAFSGSEFLPAHKEFIKQDLEAEFITMNTKLRENTSQTLLETSVFNNLNNFKSKVSQFCAEQSSKTPVIIIGGEHTVRLEKQLKAH
jgi:hypothetical protein